MHLIKKIKNAISALGVKGLLSLLVIKLEIFFQSRKKIKSSYSQMFEDYFIDKFLGFKKNGFYVDIGANDPDEMNNTKLFYLKGWRGINIDPNVDSYKKFTHARKNDVNINMGVADKYGVLSFYNFNPNVYSTFSKEEAQKRCSSGYKIIGETKVEVDSLENILEKNLPRGVNIDFMSVDTEGFDAIVLSSNNWSKFRPHFLCVEVSECTNPTLNKNKSIIDFLGTNDYKEVYFNGTNSIFIDKKNKSNAYGI
jgi:FkbM family methyltransferase